MISRIAFAVISFALTATALPAQFQGIPQDFRDRIEANRLRAEKMRAEMDANSRAMIERAKAAAGASSFRNPLGPGAPNIQGPNTQAPGAVQPAGEPSALRIAAQASKGTTGLQLTPGTVTHSTGERVFVRGDDGKPIVGRLHVSIGSTNVVLLPDGMLKSYPKTETRSTDKPFVPLTIDQFEDKLLGDPKLAGFKSIRSRRFLYVYNTSDLFIQSTRTILESMYPAVRKYFQRSGIDLHEPEMPMAVIAFSTDEEFQAYRQMPAGVVAYYDGVSNGVMLYERSRLSDHAPEIAVKNAISTIAHEGAHQILHNTGVQQRLSRWPMWLSEGLAEFYAPTSVQKRVRWSGLGSTNQLRMMEISRDWEQRRPTGNGQTVRQIAEADRLSSLDYAYSWALIHTLSRKRQKELFKCIKHCSELRPFDGTELANRPSESSEVVFEKHFGSQYDQIEIEMTKHLRSLKYVDPVKNQTHYVVQLRGSVALTTSPERVKEMQRTGSVVRIKQYPNRALAEKAMKAMAN